MAYNYSGQHPGVSFIPAFCLLILYRTYRLIACHRTSPVYVHINLIGMLIVLIVLMLCTRPNVDLQEPATSAVQKTAKAGGGGMERKSSSSSFEHRRRWMKIFGNGESHCRRSATDPWPMMQQHQLSCPPPTHLINTPTTDPKLADNNKFPNNPHLTSFLIAPPPPQEEIFINSRPLNTGEGDDEEEEEDDEDDENSQTLQLFPLRSGDGHAANGKEDTEMSVSAINGFVTHPHQFFEFLPVKNQ